MGLFKKTIDKQYEFDQGMTAVEQNDEDAIQKHCMSLLVNDKTNPDGWILKAALQLHGQDFDVEKATKAKGDFFEKLLASSYTCDELKDAFSSYRRAISYSKDESILYSYAYIFGYSLAYHVAYNCDESVNAYRTTIKRMIEETNAKFGHDCSLAFLNRLITGYEQYLDSGSHHCHKGKAKDILKVLHTLRDSSQVKSAEIIDEDKAEDDDEDDEDFFDDEDEEVTLTIMKGKKSCGDYLVTITLDDEEICVLDDTFSEKVTVIAGDYDLEITAENGSNSFEIDDSISIEADSTLKIKIANGDLEYELEEED